jgi:hypothetical protein
MPTSMIPPRRALTIGPIVLLSVLFGMGPVVAQAAETAAPVTLVELIGKKFPIGQSVDALAAPGTDAASLIRLRQGFEVEVVGTTAGNQWYQIRLPDQRIAYVPVGAIPEAAATTAEAPTPASVAVTPAVPPPVPMPPIIPVAAPAPANPAAAAPPPAPVTYPTSAQPVPASVDNGPVNDLPPIVEFAETSDVLTVLNPTAVFLAPNPRAPTAYAVRPGTIVLVIAKSTDGQWAWVNTADSQPAYIPMADLSPPG